MNKSELIDAVADKSDCSKAAAGRCVSAVFETITEELVRGEKVSVPGFGNFQVSERKEREGRNPQTGESITIPATKVASFKVGKGLKDAVKG